MSTNYDAMTDAELSEAFAVKVAGWSHDEETGIWYFGGDPENNPRFATSADAVLPLLEKAKQDGFIAGAEMLHNHNHGWTCYLHSFHETSWQEGSLRSDVQCTDLTLPRAACIALLRAKEAA
jgi:hypothetical protein